MNRLFTAPSKVGDGEIGWQMKALLTRRSSRREKDMPHDEGYGCRVSRADRIFARPTDGFGSRQGARQLIAQAVDAELNAFLASHAAQTDAAGRRRLVRHGHLPERAVQSKRRLRPIDFPVAYVGFGRMSTSGSP